MEKTEKAEGTASESFAKIMASILLVAVNTIIRGYVFTKLWIWFVVPIFQARPLRLIESMCLLLIMAYLKIKPTDVRKKDTDFWDDLGFSIFATIFIALFTLLFGYILKAII